MVKLPGTNTTKHWIRLLIFRGAMLWNITPPKKKNFPRRYQDLREGWKNTLYLVTGLHVVFNMIGNRVYTYSYNCLVSSYIVVCVKLGFINFTCIGLDMICNYILFWKKRILLLNGKLVFLSTICKNFSHKLLYHWVLVNTF